MNSLSTLDLHNVAPTRNLPPLPLLEHDRDDDYILRIDNSSLEKLQTCPRSAEHYLIHRRERAGSSALIFGGAIHAALEHLYKNNFSPEHIAEAIRIGHRHMETINLRPHDHRTPQMLSQVITLYAAQYAPHGGHDLIPLTYESSPAVEIGFSRQLGEMHLDSSMKFTRGRLLGMDCERPDEPLYIKTLHVLWSGKIDLICDYMRKPVVADHKTSSMAGPTFYEQFRLSQPVHGYMWAAAQCMGISISTFMLNALFIRKPTKTGKGIEFERRTFNYSEFHMNEWEKDVTAEIGNFVNGMLSGYFPKAPVWCMGKYGACPYHDVCTQPGKDAQMSLLFSEIYSNVNWSPLNED